MNRAAETPRTGLDSCSELRPERPDRRGLQMDRESHEKPGTSPREKDTKAGNSSPQHHDQVSYTSKQWFGVSDVEIVVANEWKHVALILELHWVENLKYKLVELKACEQSPLGVTQV